MNEIPAIVIYAGLLIGVGFGVVGLMSGFCLLSSLRDWWIERDGRKIRSFALAVAVAIIATQAMSAGGFVELGRSIYLQPSFSPALIAFGGLMFGYGMVLANGCVSRAIVLLGRGNLRSLLVLMTIAIAAEATLKGLIAPARIAFLNLSMLTPPAVSLPALLSNAGLDNGWSRLLAVAGVSGPLLIFALSHPRLSRSWGQLAAGVGIGVLISVGWFTTGYLGADDFNPVPITSLTFIAPVADTFQYIMLSTGLTLNFGVVLTIGVFAGSLFASIVTGRFQLEGFSSAHHMLRSITGASLMGCGGAMAYGCSIGQGLTGLSTLALPSFIAVIGMIGGAWIGLRAPIQIFSSWQSIRAAASAGR